MSFPPYSAYKDSGVEWLGEVPQHWPIYSLKRTVDGCVNGLWGDEPDGENDIAVIRVADFERSLSAIGLNKLTYRSITPKEKQSRLIKSGDLLIEKSGGGEKTLVGCVVLFSHEFEAITSNFVARMRPLAEFDSQFLCYAFGNLYHGRVNYPSVKQVTGIQNLDAESYLQERFCFPTRAEQTQITRFLDHETTRIDALIEEQQRLIELLKEKRQAVISHAVTKGLNPTVPMKDSGIEWLGEVPEHWEVTKFKWPLRTASGGTPPSNDRTAYYDGGIPWLRSLDLTDDIVTEHEVSVTQRAIEETSCKIVPKNSVLIAMYGGDGTIGKNGLLTFNSAINQAICAFLPSDRCKPEYLHRYIQFYRPYWMIGAESSRKDANIGQDRIGDHFLMLPPLIEQTKIVDFTNGELLRFSRLVKEAELGVALLQERRSALISAAVTGKIDVRDWQQPANASTPELAEEAM